MIRSSLRLGRAAPLLAAALLVPSASALAARPPGPDRIAVKDARQATKSTASRSVASPSAARSRAALARSIGRGAVVDIDATTGTVRAVQKTGGALTSPSGASRSSIARGWLRDNAKALGLSRADVDALGTPKIVDAPGGLSVLRFGQSVKGIPTFGGGVRAGLDRGNRLISITGSPIHALSVNSTRPSLSPAQAMKALAAAVGGSRVPAVRTRSTGARQKTTFANGDMARLVLFGAGSKQRLGWHLTYAQSTDAWWDAVVDARTGGVLYRQNLVRHAANDAKIYENFPGALAGGTAVTRDLSPFLSAGATTLSGPYVHAYSDTNGDNTANPTEEVGRSGGSFTYNLQSFNAVAHPSDNPAVPRCATHAICSWNSSSQGSWTTNRAQTTVQMFWFNNNWHDHLKGDPIGFDAASGAFEGDDPVRAESDDTIDTGNPQLNNANMGTPPDGQSPRMQMYLGAYDVNGDGDTTSDAALAEGDGLFRDYNNSDDAATVYHEYTHGLSSRLVTNADGTGALSSAQAGAMGEAWSDWYAFDYLVGQNLSPDTNAPGEVDLGIYSDAIPNATRFQPLDCGPADGAPRCPGGAGTNPGGFTYADFGKVCCSPGNLRPEVHSDGEIWAETLWDLRKAVTPAIAEAIVTNGMRLSPPEPSFLDMRNSILQADVALGRNDAATIWQVFADRGMGYFASAADGTDVTPVADSSLPPSPNGPKGSLTGKVIDQDTHKPVAGAVVGIGGLSTPGFDGALAATTGADGTYVLNGIPVHTYPKVSVAAGKGYFATSLSDVAITDGGTTTRDVSVRKSLAVGQPLNATDTTADEYGCGPAGLTDGSFGSVWELDLVDFNREAGYSATATVDLGRATDVYKYAVDPSQGCGSGADAAARQYKLEASADGQTWTTVSQGTFADDAGLTEFAPTGATASGVRYVRLSVVADQRHIDYGYLDVAELAVFGHTSPGGTLTASPSSVVKGGTVAFDASSFTTDPRAAITSYDWDFDGNGSVDQTTSTPTVVTTYGAVGSYAPSVTARDDLGGAGFGRANVTVTTTPPPPPPSPKPVKVSFPKAPKGSARFKVTCDGTCRVSAALVLSRSTAKHLKRHRRTLASRTITIKGTKTITLRVSKTFLKTLRKRHVKSFRAALRVTVRQGTKTKRISKTVRIRL